VVTNLCSRFQIPIDDEDLADKEEAEDSPEEVEEGSAVPAGGQSRGPTKKGSNASAKKSYKKK
jgi:hypothetical protein